MKEKFRELVKKKNRIYANLELIQWDLETKTPVKSKAYLSDLVGELSMQEYNLFTSDEFVNIVESLNKEKESLSEIEKKEIELSMEDIEKKKKIPTDEYEAYAKLTSINQGIWEEAKSKKDFSIVKANLEKIFNYNKKFAEYRRKDEKTLYDVLLNAKASEHSSRMVAMKNAKDNANRIAKNLTTKYNKARQSAITTEVSEITAGVESMKG